MYLWSDYSSLGRPTAEVELTFYILWFLEEVCNGTCVVIVESSLS